MYRTTRKIAAGVILLLLSQVAWAGHLFSQGTGNTDIDLSAGFGIDIPYSVLQPNSEGRVELLGEFDSGDIVCFSIGDFSRTLAFDDLPAGWTTSPAIGVGFGTTSATEPELASLDPSLPFVLRVEAVAGQFILNGIVMQVGGTVRMIGSNADANQVVQSNVTPNGNCEASPIVPPKPVPLFGPEGIILLIIGVTGIALVTRRRSFRVGKLA